jgi:hypothetical protein
MVQEKAKEISKDDKDFKASRGWLKNFIFRKNLY